MDSSGNIEQSCKGEHLLFRNSADALKGGEKVGDVTVFVSRDGRKACKAPPFVAFAPVPRNENDHIPQIYSA